jgi:hypothetical protein
MITVDDFKTNVLNITGNDFDDIIETTIDTASAVIERLCNQVILKKETTIERLNADPLIVLNNYNVPIDLSSIQVFRKTKTTDTYTVDDDFSTQKIRSFTYIVNSKDDYKNVFVKVNYEQGWELNSIPALIKNVCRNICFEVYQNSTNAVDSRRLGVSSISVNQGGITTTQTFLDLEKKWKRDLSQYRLVVI